MLNRKLLGKAEGAELLCFLCGIHRWLFFYNVNATVSFGNRLTQPVLRFKNFTPDWHTKDQHWVNCVGRSMRTGVASSTVKWNIFLHCNTVVIDSWPIYIPIHHFSLDRMVILHFTNKGSFQSHVRELLSLVFISAVSGDTISTVALSSVSWGGVSLKLLAASSSKAKGKQL